MTSSNDARSSTLHDVLAAVDRRPGPATYLQAARTLAEVETPRVSVRVALLSTFTIDMIAPYLEVELARHRLAPQLYVAPFNTVAQELLDAESGCARHDPDVVFITRGLEDVCPRLVADFLSLSAQEIDGLVDEVVTHTIGLLEAFRQRSTAALVVGTFGLPSDALLGIGEVNAARSRTEVIRELNTRQTKAVRQIPGAYALDVDHAAATVGYRQWYDEKLWHLARAPLSAPALIELARVQAAVVQAVVGRQAKCLVVDLDGTLWGGVVGEVGPDGIDLGDRFPGSAYREVQRTLLDLHRQGILLAINSKNNAGDVERVFDAHPHMVLRREHFAASRINWHDKAQNMREIAAELNIGLDTLVFVDDNPAERAFMRQALPEVRTLELPPDPLAYRRVLLQSRAFDRLTLSDEDRRRSEMYQAQQARRTLHESAATLEAFLASLAMRAEIAPAQADTLPRIFDLVQKTNQFNVTTRRHSAAAIARMAADPNHGVFTLRLSDRFGDQGIVGVGIVGLEGDTAHLDTLLLSCRVIGRNVETAFLSYLTTWAQSRSAKQFEGEFIPTPKNAPAQDVFSRHGFAHLAEGASGRTRWQLSLDNVAINMPAYIACDVPAGIAE